jgi:hypothetical protein
MIERNRRYREVVDELEQSIQDCKVVIENEMYGIRPVGWPSGVADALNDIDVVAGVLQRGWRSTIERWEHEHGDYHKFICDLERQVEQAEPWLEDWEKRRRTELSGAAHDGSTGCDHWEAVKARLDAEYREWRKANLPLIDVPVLELYIPVGDVSRLEPALVVVEEALAGMTRVATDSDSADGRRMRQSRLKVIGGPNAYYIELDRVRYPVKDAAAMYVQALIEADGHPVSFRKLQGQHPDRLGGEIGTRLLDGLPPDVTAHIERPGQGSLCRLKVDGLR